jgi:hypothetical protein
MNPTFGILEIIVAVVGIVVTVILVKEARKYLVDTWRKISRRARHYWSHKPVRLGILFILESIILIILVNITSLTTEILVALLVVSAFKIFGTLSVFKQQECVLEETSQHLHVLETRVDKLFKTRHARVEIIRTKWSNFLDALSTHHISLTAVASLLKSAELYDFNGSIIVLRIPPVLEPTYRALAERIKEVEPLLKEIYGEPYHLCILVDS